MKKNHIVFIAVFLALIVVALVMVIGYFKPDDATKSKVAAAESKAKISSPVLAAAHPMENQPAPQNIPAVASEPLERDFNRLVYGENYEQDMSVGRDASIEAPYDGTRKILEDTKSDPNITAINPQQDPSNQLYRPKSQTEVTEPTVELPKGETGGVIIETSEIDVDAR